MRILVTGGAGFIGSNLTRLRVAGGRALGARRAKLGWAPQEDFQSGFRKTVRWYIDNPAWIQGTLDGPTASRAR
jgi:dTDP-D-glucose 4,6-dehydratase